MKKIKTFDEHNSTVQSKVPFTKQTMKLDIDWRAAKDFDLHYYYKWVCDHRIKNDENGCNLPNGADSWVADTSKLDYMSKQKKDWLYEYALSKGGSPKPAFTIKKDTKIKVVDEKYNLIIEILDGPYAGEKFEAKLSDFRTCLVGEAKDENLVVSKYKIFLNGEPLKSKYYTNMGRIKLALLNAFGFQNSNDNDNEDGVPYYISDSSSTTLSKNDCKNVKIIRYDNNSKVGIPVDFNVLEFYVEYLEKKELKKDSKKYNL